MAENIWVKTFPGSVIVTDENGTITELNDRAAEGFAALGGRALIGTNVLDCHPEPSRTKLADLMAGRVRNVYTIEKAGVKKLIYQVPRIEGGQFKGYVEISLEIPFEMPHFVRTG